MPLGVGRRELAAGVARAGDQPGSEAGGVPVEAEVLDGAPGRLDERPLGDVGDQEVLPDGQPDACPQPKPVGDRGQPAHLRDGHPADRQHDADVTPAGLASAGGTRRAPSGPSGAGGSQRSSGTPAKRAARAPPPPRRGSGRSPRRRAGISGGPSCGRCGRRA